MKIYTIGFTRKTAFEFFETLKSNNIRRLIDVRINNSSQLAGFSKKSDLEYFLKVICNADYVHMPLLAPTLTLKDDYKKGKLTCADFSSAYYKLIRARKIENVLDKESFKASTVFLCSEAKPEYCHRKILVEYLKELWKDVEEIDL